MKAIVEVTAQMTAYAKRDGFDDESKWLVWLSKQRMRKGSLGDPFPVSQIGSARGNVHNHYRHIQHGNVSVNMLNDWLKGAVLNLVFPPGGAQQWAERIGWIGAGGALMLMYVAWLSATR